jgi:FPC/CPF motif-containing protein YcgG
LAAIQPAGQFEFFQFRSRESGVSYHHLEQGKTDRVLALSPGGTPEPFAHLVHGALKGWIGSSGFPCNGAKSAFNIGSYRLGTYDTFSDSDVSLLADDLTAYINEYNNTPAVSPKPKQGDKVPLNLTFATFLACFKEEPVCDETTFEDRLWALLENLRVSDTVAWPAGFSSDAQDNDFAFCFGGEGFFVAAFHPGSWRWSRRFMFPLIVFNMHKQFDGLKTKGTFTTLRDTIRKNDDKLQSTANNLVADFGTQSEAPQYAMRKVPAGWTPPHWGG